MGNKTRIILTVSILVAAAVGFFGGMEYKAYQIRQAINSSFKTITDGLGPVTNNTNSQNQRGLFIDKNIGDEIQLTTLKFRVNGAVEKQILEGNGFSAPMVAKEGAKFVVINLDITNSTNTEFVFWSDDGFVLKDGQGRQFIASSVLHLVGDSLDARHLKPDITEKGVIVYEIPSNAASYSLEIRKAGTNEIYRVKLK